MSIQKQIAGMNLFDMLATLVSVGMFGLIEVNPIVASLFGGAIGVTVFIIAKVGLSWVWWNLKVPTGNEFLLKAVVFVWVMYAFLTLWHLFGLVMILSPV